MNILNEIKLQEYIKKKCQDIFENEFSEKRINMIFKQLNLLREEVKIINDKKWE